MQRIGSLHPQELGKPLAFADGHEIISHCGPLPIQLRFDDKDLHDALGGDARGISFNRRLCRPYFRLLRLHCQ
jgi:hypothetical protein